MRTKRNKLLTLMTTLIGVVALAGLMAAIWPSNTAQADHGNWRSHVRSGISAGDGIQVTGQHNANKVTVYVDHKIDLSKTHEGTAYNSAGDPIPNTRDSTQIKSVEFTFSLIDSDREGAASVTRNCARGCRTSHTFTNVGADDRVMVIWQIHLEKKRRYQSQPARVVDQWTQWDYESTLHHVYSSPLEEQCLTKRSNQSEYYFVARHDGERVTTERYQTTETRACVDSGGPLSDPDSLYLIQACQTTGSNTQCNQPVYWKPQRITSSKPHRGLPTSSVRSTSAPPGRKEMWRSFVHDSRVPWWGSAIAYHGEWEADGETRRPGLIAHITDTTDASEQLLVSKLSKNSSGRWWYGQVNPVRVDRLSRHIPDPQPDPPAQEDSQSDQSGSSGTSMTVAPTNRTPKCSSGCTKSTQYAKWKKTNSEAAICDRGSMEFSMPAGSGVTELKYRTHGAGTSVHFSDVKLTSDHTVTGKVTFGAYGQFPYNIRLFAMRYDSQGDATRRYSGSLWCDN